MGEDVVHYSPYNRDQPALSLDDYLGEFSIPFLVRDCVQVTAYDMLRGPAGRGSCSIYIYRINTKSQNSPQNMHFEELPEFMRKTFKADIGFQKQRHLISNI